jgi:hypothetical protein
MTIERALMGQKVASAPIYVDDVFSADLYTGTGASLTITNGLDLAGKGGMVWLKSRSGATDHALYDTVRGATSDLTCTSTAAPTTQSTGLTAFNSTGFTIGALAKLNTSAATNVAWSFRKAPNFFDVVTYTGTGVSGRQVPHSLGSAPGLIIVKRIDAATTSNWAVYQPYAGGPGQNFLMETTGAGTAFNYFTASATSSYFSVSNHFNVNGSGATYIAYLFADNATGFGSDGSQSIIRCGSFSSSASTTVTLGWEPQLVLVKTYSTTGNWEIHDVERGESFTSSATLNPNLTNAETVGTTQNVSPTATGFIVNGTNRADTSSSCIYVAIRRSHKPPTSGTNVFNPVLQATSTTAQNKSYGNGTDLVIVNSRGTTSKTVWDRLRGPGLFTRTNATTLNTSTTDALLGFDLQSGVRIGVDSLNVIQSQTGGSVHYAFTRASGFLDVVVFAGDGTFSTRSHNLGVVPEFILQKSITGVTSAWGAYTATAFGNLNTTAAFTAATNALTASAFTPLADASGSSYTAYLFASCTGVSKIGTYTGNGTSITINCGFTAGARFVMIKCTSTTGDWYVWDTARGIVASTDPHTSFNTAVAEVTTDDTIDPDSTGFIVNQLAATNVNVNTATYFYMAIA